MPHVRDVETQLSVTDQHYTLSYITPLFDTQAPTCFIHVPSPGSFLGPRELLESRNISIVCHILGVLVACVPWLLWSRVLCCPAARSWTTHTEPPQPVHTGHQHSQYMTNSITNSAVK
jgi:hypothetical protein